MEYFQDTLKAIWEKLKNKRFLKALKNILKSLGKTFYSAHLS